MHMILTIIDAYSSLCHQFPGSRQTPIHIEFLNHFAPKKSLQNAEAATKWRQTIAKSANRFPMIKKIE